MSDHERAERQKEQREIDADRRHERVLIPKALLAFALVAVLIIIRQVFFS